MIDTRLESWIELQPNLGGMQNKIYNLLKVYPDSSNRDLHEISGMDINSVTPRVNELCSLGLVICSGYKKDSKTNRKVMIWKVNENWY